MGGSTLSARPPGGGGGCFASCLILHVECISFLFTDATADRLFFAAIYSILVVPPIGGADVCMCTIFEGVFAGKEGWFRDCRRAPRLLLHHSHSRFTPCVNWRVLQCDPPRGSSRTLESTRPRPPHYRPPPLAGVCDPPSPLSAGSIVASPAHLTPWPSCRGRPAWGNQCEGGGQAQGS